MKKVVFWAMKAASCLALFLAVSNVNSACFFNCYQPEVPEAAMRFKK
ncbi:MAG: cyclic lactone autoinducer peptide [Oscillospiraceae bacterium]|nr:cyclic lactone autoinducer peptide [Oscillospiraceae bacterium]